MIWLLKGYPGLIPTQGHSAQEWSGQPFISTMKPSWASQSRVQALESEDGVQILLKIAPEIQASTGNNTGHWTLTAVRSSCPAWDGPDPSWGSQPLGFMLQLRLYLAVQPRVSSFTSLCLSSLICKVGVINADQSKKSCTTTLWGKFLPGIGNMC